MEFCEALAVYHQHLIFVRQCLDHLPKSCTPPLVLRAWEKGGLLVPDWSAEGNISRLWINVCSHMAAGAVLAYGLALPLTHYLRPEGISPANVAVALLLHDAFKRIEQERVAAAERQGEDRAEVNQQAESDAGLFLSEVGFEESIVTMAATTGDFGIRKILARKKEASLLGCKLAFYVDCCISGRKITTYKKRFDALLPCFEPGGIYHHIDPAFRREFGRGHRETYDSVVLPLQQELAEFIGFTGNPDELPLHYAPQFVQG